MQNENYLVTKRKVNRTINGKSRNCYGAYLTMADRTKVICFSKKLLDLLPVERMSSLNGRRVVFDGTIAGSELVDCIYTPVLINIIIHNIA